MYVVYQCFLYNAKIAKDFFLTSCKVNDAFDHNGPTEKFLHNFRVELLPPCPIPNVTEICFIVLMPNHADGQMQDLPIRHLFYICCAQNMYKLLVTL